MSDTVTLTKDQREHLCELVDNLLEDTSDWQVPTDEYNDCIMTWTDILRELGFHEKADKLDEDLLE